MNSALANFSQMDPYGAASRASDKMSLSSLSPGDNKIQQEEPSSIPASRDTGPA